MKKSLFILTLCAAVVGCKNLPDLPDFPDIPVPQPEPTPVPEPTPEPVPDAPEQPINRGGDGLYKPEANLWLLPSKHPTNGQRFLAEHLGTAGEFRDENGTELVKYFKWPGGVGAISDQPMDGAHPAIGINPDDGSMYFSAQIKCRSAKANATGNWFIARDIYNQLIFKKQIQDRNVRQE